MTNVIINWHRVGVTFDEQEFTWGSPYGVFPWGGFFDQDEHKIEWTKYYD